MFGPGLNRAYELESKVAIYPRIVVDEPVLKIGAIAGFDFVENGAHFLDPFTPHFIKLWFDRSDEHQGTDRAILEAGISSVGRSLKDVPGDIALQAILETLKKRIISQLDDKEWAKVAWLYDRIATRLGVPLAISYPRVRPGDAVQ